MNGNYNNTTATAVSQFKQAAGLKPDGIVDAITWQRLFPSQPIAASTLTAPANSTKPVVVPAQANNTNLKQTTLTGLFPNLSQDLHSQGRLHLQSHKKLPFVLPHLVLHQPVLNQLLRHKYLVLNVPLVFNTPHKDCQFCV